MPEPDPSETPSPSAGEAWLLRSPARTQQVAVIDQRIGSVLEAVREVAPDATVLVASLADSGTRSMMQLAVADGPALGNVPADGAVLDARSTRQPGMVQSTDLMPTLLAWLGIDGPPSLVGAPLQVQPDGRTGAERAAHLKDVSDHAVAVRPLKGPFHSALVVVNLLLYAAVTVGLNRKNLDRAADRLGRRESHTARRAAEALRSRRPATALGVGLFCQSASAGLALRSTAARRGLPVASFLSSGLRVDVSGNDTMQFWSVHEPTAVGAVYLESIGNPRKFSRIARRLSATTPLVAVVSGQTGQATPPGHAVRTSTQPQRVLTEMLRQAGVVRARTQREMLDVAGLLLAQPLPAGPRTAVVSSSASLAALVADVAAAQGLQVAGRPVTLDPLAGAEAYESALTALRARDDWDAVVIAVSPPLGRTDPAVAAPSHEPRPTTRAPGWRACTACTG
ncbi:hypothetical protein [Georgenia sp. SUBG003]|uniref:hypothetical protein n=1 Tax=Georgenia sp. SUBG003 TaxID=1497974 RepID=UPI003AB6A83C